MIMSNDGWALDIALFVALNGIIVVIIIMTECCPGKSNADKRGREGNQKKLLLMYIISR